MKKLVLIIYLTGIFRSVNERKGETVIVRGEEKEGLFHSVYETEEEPVIVLGEKPDQDSYPSKSARRLSPSVGDKQQTVLFAGIFSIVVQFFSGIGRAMEQYTDTVKDSDEPVKVLEGKSVILETRLEYLEPDHQVYWTRGRYFSGTELVTWKNSFTKYNEELKDFLLLDPQTGSLTITNVSKDHSGFYCVKVLKGPESHILRKYQVSVYGVVSAPDISTKHSLNPDDPWSCQVICSVQNSDNVVLTWYKGEKELNSSSDTNLSTDLTLSLNVPLDSSEEIYRCEAANPISKRAVTLTTTYWCPKHQTVKGFPIIAVIIIVSVVLLTTAGLTTIIVMVRRKRSVKRSFSPVRRTENTSSQESTDSVEEKGENNSLNP